jgi:hypothetical protein
MVKKPIIRKVTSRAIKTVNDPKPKELTVDELINGIHHLMGYVQNGSQESLRMYQDDATREYGITIGTGRNRTSYHGSCFKELLLRAIKTEVETNPI